MRAICRGATRAVGVALIGLVLVAGCTHSSSPAASKPPPRFSRADATRLNRSLASGREPTVRSAIAMPAGQRLSASAARELAAVVPITFNQSSFHLLDTAGAVQAKPGGVRCGRATYVDSMVWLYPQVGGEERALRAGWAWTR